MIIALLVYSNGPPKQGPSSRSRKNTPTPSCHLQFYCIHKCMYNTYIYIYILLKNASASKNIGGCSLVVALATRARGFERGPCYVDCRADCCSISVPRGDAAKEVVRWAVNTFYSPRKMHSPQRVPLLDPSSIHICIFIAVIHCPKKRNKKNQCIILLYICRI